MTTNGEWVLDVYDAEGGQVMVVRTPSEEAAEQMRAVGVAAGFTVFARPDGWEMAEAA